MIEDQLKNAALTIREGGVVAFPTETFYGLAADPRNKEALARILAIKGRDAAKGIPLIAASNEVVAQHFLVPSQYEAALKRIWPAPLTVAMGTGATLPSILAGDFDTVAVRVSDLELARNLARMSTGIITATSANLSGAPPVTQASDLSVEIKNQVDDVLDVGSTPGGLPSTIIGFTREGYRVFREGAYNLAKLEAEFSRT